MRRQTGAPLRRQPGLSRIGRDNRGSVARLPLGHCPLIEAGKNDEVEIQSRASTVPKWKPRMKVVARPHGAHLGDFVEASA
jgi:hypothetical protein